MTDIKRDTGTGLTALVPTFNSEAILEECLKSVSCADEILVIDSFSSDHTVEIACKHGARVIQHAYENSARQKNRAIPLCANTWVLQLDTDERLEPALQEEIRETIRTAPAGVDAFEMRTKNFLFGKWSRTMDLYPGWRVRLFRRDAGRFEEKEVDARVIVAGKVAQLQHHVLHFGTERVTDRLGKLDRYSRYEAEERIKVRRPFSAAQMIMRTAGTFLYYYIAKRGITDGIRGLLYSVHKAEFIFWTYAKMWEASGPRGKTVRIILLPSTYAPRIGGVERVAGELAREFRRLGHEVRVLTNRYPRQLPGAEVREGVPVRRLHFLLPRLRYLRQGRLALLLAATILAPVTFFRLCVILLRTRPDIVNVHYLGAPAPFVLAARALMRFRLIVSFHGADVQVEPLRSRFDRWLFRLALKEADRVTYCSNALRDEAAAVDPSADGPSVVIHNGVDTAVIAAAVPERRERAYLFAAGRLERQKGFDLLIAAFARAAGGHPDTDLVIAGEGPERKALEAAAEEHCVAKRVVFMGPCPPERVAALMKGSLRTVIPSRREPFGIVGMEARVAGVPVIAAAVGGLPEALAGADVVWCPPDSMSDLAQAIGNALEDVSGKPACARAGNPESATASPDVASANVSWQSVARKYLQVYQR